MTPQTPLPGFTLPLDEDDSDRKLLADISRVGWHVVHILADEKGPPFTFSVGLYYTFRQPEILVMGLRHEIAHQLINVCVVHFAGGRAFEMFQRTSEVAENYDCVFIPISPDNYRDYLGYAIWFYRTLPRPFPAIQLVWPDKQGKFPWEEGYDQRFSLSQKMLGKSSLSA